MNRYGLCAPIALLSLLLAYGSVVAGEPSDTAEAHVRAALAEAGENRGEIERVLLHYAVAGRRLHLEAARHLVANMPGKSYIVTRLKDKNGNTIPFDPLDYPDFKAALAALEAIEKEHGEVDFARDRKVEDLQTITAAFLIGHIDASIEAWEATPENVRVDFATFLAYILPYRGSQEPIDTWITPLRRRYAARARDLATGKLDAKALYGWLSKDVHKRVRFDERFYLHPTDQGFTEMGRSGQGRCEDITNMITFAARSMALATAADYTPAWAHRDNNHAWNVLLDAEGRGSAPSNAHAAKVYRKTYAIQRKCLAFRLPEGRKAPNRFLQSTSYVDVTDQYAPTTDVRVDLDAEAAGAEGFAYLCVFNGGRWVAIHWGPIADGRVTFDRMGRNIAYLPAVHDGEKLVPAACPRIVHKDGSVELLAGSAAGVPLLATSVAPKKVSPDTQAVTPVSYLEAGVTYRLQRWNGSWETVKEVEAGEEPLRFAGLPADGLYWLVPLESRRLERIFTIRDGRQRWW